MKKLGLALVTVFASCSTNYENVEMNQDVKQIMVSSKNIYNRNKRSKSNT